jgi:hypothetical protein
VDDTVVLERRLEPASFSALVPRRTPSSATTGSPPVKTGTIWLSKAPLSCAAAARSCDCAEYSSSLVRENPHSPRSSSAEIPWLNEKSP